MWILILCWVYLSNGAAVTHADILSLYGLDTYSSNIQLVLPLTKEQISTDNGGWWKLWRGNYWDGGHLHTSKQKKFYAYTYICTTTAEGSVNSATINVQNSLHIYPPHTHRPP